MNKRELVIVSILTVVLVLMDISGFPSSLFVNIEVYDITPFYWTLMCNFILMGGIAFFTLKYLCPNWKLGLHREGIVKGYREYGVAGIVVGLITLVAFYVGLRPFDYKPTIWKVLIEGIIYYVGVAFMEELYVRGLLLNLIEKLFAGSKHKTMIAIVVSSVLFGLGHIFGVLGQPPFVILAKIIWTIAMGMYFGAIYKKTNNLWLPITLHFLINICALPYCFSTMQGYANLSLYIVVPAYFILGIYSVCIVRNRKA